jgi:putative tryptophan/tyrosine transport system substrate-binding protein
VTCAASLIGCALAVLVFGLGVAETQQFSKVPKIGLLGTQSASQSSERLAAFRLGLAEHGYIVGQNIIIEERWADGQFDLLDKLVEDLVRLNVDVVLAIGGTPSIRGQKRNEQNSDCVCRIGDRSGRIRTSEEFCSSGR